MKRIGRYVKSPRDHDAKRSYAAAKIVDDAVDFHGAKLTVKVHHSYPSRLFKDRISIAAGRSVELEESGIRVWIDDSLVQLTLLDERQWRRKNKAPPPYGGFAEELPKRLLKTFPVLYEYRRDGTFEGVTIFRGKRGEQKSRRRGARSAKT